MSGISTHILDTANGRPAAGIPVHLSLLNEAIGSGVTNRDGRVQALLPEGKPLKAGSYRIVYQLGDYFPQGFYPEVSITFVVRDEAKHYHIPLLISPFGYTTYRGS